MKDDIKKLAHLIAHPDLCEATNLLVEAQKWVKDPQLQNRMDRFFGREPANREAEITLNDKPLKLLLCEPSVADVRIHLAPEQAGYSMWRESKGSDPDQQLNDTMRVFDGDIIYSTPPCHCA